MEQFIRERYWRSDPIRTQRLQMFLFLIGHILKRFLVEWSSLMVHLLSTK
nr:MAG TPA: hypothetical protein [Caudoviricetes sp.]